LDVDEDDHGAVRLREPVQCPLEVLAEEAVEELLLRVPPPQQNGLVQPLEEGEVGCVRTHSVDLGTGRVLRYCEKYEFVRIWSIQHRNASRRRSEANPCQALVRDSATRSSASARLWHSRAAAPYSSGSIDST
jgi:hypothetical protein